MVRTATPSWTANPSLNAEPPRSERVATPAAPGQGGKGSLLRNFPPGLRSRVSIATADARSCNVPGKVFRLNEYSSRAAPLPRDHASLEPGIAVQPLGAGDVPLQAVRTTAMRAILLFTPGNV